MSFTEDIQRNESERKMRDMQRALSTFQNPSKTFVALNPISAMKFTQQDLGKCIAHGEENRSAKVSPLAAKFETLWQQLKGQHLTPEHRFAPPRRWRFDYAHLIAKVAIEIDGGLFLGSRGGHTSPKGFASNCEKTNAASSGGWFVFRLCTGMVTEANILPIIATIRRLTDP